MIYLVSLPLDMYAAPDEGHALHEAKRLLDGEVLYRDVFELATPGWFYLMACMFRVFGTTLATARTTAAVLHAATVLGVFLLCRQLGVRRWLACAAAATQLTVCQPAWPIASYHWLATLLCIGLLLWSLPLRRDAFWSVGTGIIVGLLIATHQHRGLSMGLGICAVLVAEVLLERRYGHPQRQRSC